MCIRDRAPNSDADSPTPLHGDSGDDATSAVDGGTDGGGSGGRNTTPSRPGSSNEENDDGLGSSDDETISSGSTATIGDHDDDDDRRGDLEDEDDHGSVSGESRGFESDSSPNLKAVAGRKVIKPDASAINQLLAFDEVGK